MRSGCNPIFPQGVCRISNKIIKINKHSTKLHKLFKIIFRPVSPSLLFWAHFCWCVLSFVYHIHTHTHTHTLIYIYIYIYLADRCCGQPVSFLFNSYYTKVSLDCSTYPWSVPYNAECYARNHQVPSFWVFAMTWLGIESRSSGPWRTLPLCQWPIYIHLFISLFILIDRLHFFLFSFLFFFFFFFFCRSFLFLCCLCAILISLEGVII